MHAPSHETRVPSHRIPHTPSSQVALPNAGASQAMSHEPQSVSYTHLTLPTILRV